MPNLTQDVADKAQVIGAALARDVDAIRNNPDLTPEARTRRIAEAYQRSKTKMDQLQESWRGGSQKTETTLDRDLFGAMNATGADAISFRDAADRASKLEAPEEAARLLEQADRTGDDVLAKAIAQRAYEMRGGIFGAGGYGWVEVLNQYTSSRPDLADKIDRLDAARSNDVYQNLAAAFQFTLPKPTELERMSDWSIADLAGTTPHSA